MTLILLIHNPSTPTSDQDRISLYNINTTSSRRVTRIKKNINYGISGWSNSKFPKLTYKICMADSKENLWWDIGIERVKVTLFLSFNRVTLFFFSFSSTSELNVNLMSQLPFLFQLLNVEWQAGDHSWITCLLAWFGHLSPYLDILSCGCTVFTEI